MPPVQGTKRLSDKDVREIFSCLFEYGKRPPSHLCFQIVPVGPNGLKLSPPSHEFEDGLYVLLRPQSKKKSAPIPQPPVHLHDLVVRNALAENCAWSLSGPQFPVTNKPGALQQRYCYPKGRPEYSSYKGGALWTMRGVDGKEDCEFRLLHVYQSQKRAANKGVTLTPSTTPLSCEYTQYQPVAKKPRYISPARERVVPAVRCSKIMFPDSNIHRINSCATLETTLSFPTLEHGFSHSFESIQANAPASSPRLCPDTLSSQDPSFVAGHYCPNNHHPPHPTCSHEQLDFNFQDLHNDPMLQEMEQQRNVTHETKFLQRLGVVHEKICKYIFDQPEHLQPTLVSTLAGWARAMAMDPLSTRSLQNDDYRETYGRAQDHHACC
ncbi:hypothetical protein MPSEU_000267300 [Mayamaea pseudoterrestris]|nr:hypothetical protein MPSEU_000267300 [Mayamaea pseudoterrestris]